MDVVKTLPLTYQIKNIALCLSILICIIFSGDYLQKWLFREKPTERKAVGASQRLEMAQLSKYVADLCPANKIWPFYPKKTSPDLFCYYYHNNKRNGVGFLTNNLLDAKIEIINRKPLVMVVHEFFPANEIRDIATEVKGQHFFKPLYTNQYGFSWVSKDFTHKQALLFGRNWANNFIFDKLAQLTDATLPCNGHYPTMNVAKYKKGDFLKVHHDGYGSHITNVSWTQNIKVAVRSVISWFEDCRLIYSQLNLFKCLYMLGTDNLPSSLYWKFEKFGTPVSSALIQLAGDLGGGETFFPILNLSIHTNLGDVLYFENTDDTGRQLLRPSLHGACPVLDGQKLIVVGRFPGRCNHLPTLRRQIFLRN